MKEIKTVSAPAPVGPYVQAVQHGDLIFASGQIPLDPETSKLAGDDIEAQTERVIANLEAVLVEAGSGLHKVVRTTVYLVDLSLFPRVNAVYARHFTGTPPPARATVGVAALPLGAQVEIDAIAHI